MSQSRKRKSLSPQPSCSKRKDPQPLVSSTSNHFMKPGTLAKIAVRNFMCHDTLVVNLKNGMNFLMGRNGSGKSAILTAVVVGLGGKASVTNRGNSLKEFIKKGQNFCSIEITLNNIGLDAYKPDVFGDKITITRAINISGTSAYKIKSASGDIVTNKRDELEKIVTAFNIQVDNPVCILNQDTARTFLNSSDPREKFKMFVRATYLEYIQHSLDEALECVFKSRSILKTKTEAFKSTEKEMKELEDKWNRVQGLQTHQERCAALKMELPWAKAAEAKSQAEKVSEELEAVHQTITRFENEVESLNNKIAEIQTHKSSLHQKLNDYQNQREVLDAQARRLRAQLQERKHALREKVQAVQVVDERIAQHEQNATALLSQINDIQARSQEGYQRERARVCEERVRLQEQLECLKGMEGTRQGEAKMLETQLVKLRQRQLQLQQERQEVSTGMARIQQEIKSVRNSSRNSLSVYAAWMPDLVSRIESAFKARKFSKKPIGPLGAFIKTKDASWNPAIENFLKYSWLRTFCCNSTEDSHLLVQIMEQIVPRNNYKPTIVISTFLDKMHNVSAHKVKHPVFSSLLDMLIIDHPVVANCLIDTNEVERVLLVPTDREACALMERPENVPANCARAITKRGYEYLANPYCSYGPTNKNLQARVLQVTMDQYKRNLEMEADEFHRKVTQAESQLVAATAEMKTTKQQLDENLRQLHAVTKQLRDTTSAIDQLSFEEPQAQNVEDLSREMAACTAEAERLRGRREALMEDQEPVKLAVDQLKDQLERTEQGEGSPSAPPPLRSVEAVQQELNNCRRYIDGVAQELGNFEEIERSYNSYKSKYGKIRSTLTSLTSKLKDTEGRLQFRKQVHERAKRSFSTIMNYCFMSLLNNADFKGRVRINYDEKTLSLEVEPPSNKGSGIQRYTESLSGGERSYSTVSFIMALWQIVRPPFYFLDEFDVFMDKVNRGTVLKLLQSYADKNMNSQYVLLTPLDLASVNTSNVHVYMFDDPRP